MGIGPARLLARALEGRGHRALLADPLETRLPLLDRMCEEHPPGTGPEPMERPAGMIRQADAVAVVSAEHNHGIPPAPRNLLDHFPEEWFGLPRGICTCSPGRFGASAPRCGRA